MGSKNLLLVIVFETLGPPRIAGDNYNACRWLGKCARPEIFDKLPSEWTRNVRRHYSVRIFMCRSARSGIQLCVARHVSHLSRSCCRGFNARIAAHAPLPIFNHVMLYWTAFPISSCFRHRALFPLSLLRSHGERPFHSLCKQSANNEAVGEQRCSGVGNEGQGATSHSR